MESALELGMERAFPIKTPLMRLTKAETWALAKAAGRRGPGRADPRATATPATSAAREPLHDWGAAAATCPACELRANGWHDWVAAGPPGARGRRGPMTYSVKEIFLTLQGEGGQAGRAAVFCRFAGCNLWSGLRAGPRRAPSAPSATPTSSGPTGRAAASSAPPPTLAAAVAAAWAGPPDNRLVVLTGGEPLLQLDDAAGRAPCTRAGFSIALETNGTIAAPAGVDWICVSPKADAALAQTSGQELKLVYPQAGVDPARFEHLAFERFSLQPMDGPDRDGGDRAPPSPIASPTLAGV